jgi:hypothetical protein
LEGQVAHGQAGSGKIPCPQKIFFAKLPKDSRGKIVATSRGFQAWKFNFCRGKKGGCAGSGGVLR